MESFESSFTGSKKKKQQQKRTRTLILIGAAVVIVAVTLVLVFTLSKKDGSDTSTLSYRVGSVSSGEIRTTISGSGTLSALEAKTVTTTAESTVTAVNAKPGDAIKAGDVVLTMTSSEVESQLDELKSDLTSTRSSLASAKQLLTNLKVTNTKAGIVKDIVGLLTESGSSTDSQILIPLTTAQRISDSTSISNCYVQASSTNSVSQAQSLTEQQMLSLTGDEDSYDVYNMSEILDTMDDVMSTLSLMLGGIAAISLLVGGIGIMNIMLVSVAERTREIGIRKAIGARRSHIMMQFLIEACVLSILGGLIGLGLSALGLQIYGLIADTTISMEWVAAMGSLLFCVIIGVAFGSYPAAKASKMTPIDALQRN